MKKKNNLRKIIFMEIIKSKENVKETITLPVNRSEETKTGQFKFLWTDSAPCLSSLKA